MSPSYFTGQGGGGWWAAAPRLPCHCPLLAGKWDRIGAGIISHGSLCQKRLEEKHLLNCLQEDSCKLRIVERLRLEGTAAGPPVQGPCCSRATQSRLPCTVSRWLVNIPKVGDSAASLGNPCQGSVSLGVERCFLMSRGHPLCFSLCPLPLVLSLGATEKSLAPSSGHPCDSTCPPIHKQIKRCC